MNIVRWLLLFVSVATIAVVFGGLSDQPLEVTEAPSEYDDDQEEEQEDQPSNDENANNEVIITESPEEAGINDPDAQPSGPLCFENCESWLQQILAVGLNAGSAKAMLWSCNAYGNYVMCLNENCGSIASKDISQDELSEMMERRMSYALIEPGCGEPHEFVQMLKCRDRVINKNTCRRIHSPSFKLGLDPIEVDSIITKMLTNLKCEENVIREQCGDTAANLAIRSVRQRIFTYLSFRGWSFHASDQSQQNKELLDYFAMREITSLVKEEDKIRVEIANETRDQNQNPVALPLRQEPSGAGIPVNFVSSILAVVAQVVIFRVFV